MVSAREILDEMDSTREKRYRDTDRLRSLNGFRSEWNKYQELIISEFGGYGNVE